MQRAANVVWTWEQRLIALNLYFKLPFGKLHKGNPLIIDVARKMGRTPSSLAIKLCNFASLDPVLTARGIKGMTGVAAGDRVLWDEFKQNRDILVPQSEQMLHDLFTQDDDQEVNFLDRGAVKLERTSPLRTPTGPTDATATIRIRRGQQFFRQSILTAYDLSCCISGINVPKLLIASHIKPWRDFPDERLEPRNGLCLSALHDAAFDAGLITLNRRLQVMLSPKLRRFFPQRALEENFVPFEGKQIRLPNKLAEPSAESLRYHREVIFVR
jgi:predicted restriction endonuclease